MKQLISFLFSVCVLSPVFSLAQPHACDGNRYINEVFSNVQETLDVQYGQATTLGGTNLTLRMNIYEPLGDTLSQRPVVVMAHGGSFVGGSRTDLTSICEDIAKRGYVAATISYRLLDALVFDSTAISEEVVMAINDMKAAVRFFREDADSSNTYRVNPDLIFVGGISAGGIMASHVAMMDTTDNIPAYVQTHINNNGGFEGNSSDNTQYSSQVQGLLNYSGALLRDHWIDAEDPPFYSAHDDADPVVPCDYGTTNAVPFPVFLYGSCEMKEVGDELGIDNQLFLVENSSGHVSFLGASYATVMNESAVFLEEIICAATATSIEEVESVERLEVFPNPSVGDVVIRVPESMGRYDVAIYSLAGQKIFSKFDISDSELKIPDLGIPEGMYLVKVIDRKNEMRLVERLILR